MDKMTRQITTKPAAHATYKLATPVELIEDDLKVRYGVSATAHYFDDSPENLRLELELIKL